MNTINDVRARFSMAMINEGKGSVKKNSKFISWYDTNPDAQTFMEKSLPDGLPREAFIDMVEKLNPKETDELIGLFQSKGQDVNLEAELNKINYTNKQSVAGKLFNAKNTGIGTGEILIAWIFKGATINGGNQSFDVLFNGQQFEVKDLGSSSKIKVGTEGMVTKFIFHKEFVDTLRRMEKLTNGEKIDLDTHLKPEERRVWDRLSAENDVDKAMSGEVGIQRLNLFKDFYRVFSQSKLDDVKGYTNAILRGPYSKPIELKIDPLELESYKPGDTITFTISKSDLDRTYLITELRRLRYVRNPELIDSDMQEAVEKLVANKSFIFFNNKGEVKITRNIKSNTYTQGRMIVEPA